MASRFSLVNRGYDVEKVGPSTTNRYLRPPRRVGEITPTTNLRDEKNAKGPLAKVKLTPQVQTGDDTGIKSTSVNTDPSYMTATQLSRSMDQSRAAKDFTSFVDPTTPMGMVVAAVVPGAGVASAINYSASKQISAVQAEAQNRLTAIDKAMRTEEEMAKNTDVQTLISLGARRGVVSEQRARSINKATEAKAFVTASKETISGGKNTPTLIGSSGNDRLRREKNKNQEQQLGGGNDYSSALAEDSPTFGVF
tara:strand:+ start:3172 stop:3927 length:756 start_codon:yes stop_codon:yes gene_type:complete